MALHDLGHEIEGTVGIYDSEQLSLYWAPMWAPVTACGDIHGHLNSWEDYKYDEEDIFVWSTCGPQWREGYREGMTTQEINCQYWRCDTHGFLRMWVGNMPQEWWEIADDGKPEIQEPVDYEIYLPLIYNQP